MKQPDSWCKPTPTANGKLVYGGAARNVRIAASGGMDQIIQDVARDALARADAAVHSHNRPKLRLVSNG